MGSGIDLGLLSFIATSDGETIHRPVLCGCPEPAKTWSMCVGNGEVFASCTGTRLAKLVPCGTHTGKRLWLNRSTIAITVAMKRTET